MKSKTTKPTSEYIQALKSEMDAALSQDKLHWEDIANVRAGRHPIYVPEPWSNTAIPIQVRATGDTLRRVISSLTISMPTVTVPPAGKGPKHQENATLREKWSTALLSEMDSARLPTRTFRAGMDHAATFGRGIWKLIYTPNTWHDYPTPKSLFNKRVSQLTPQEEKELSESRDMYKRGRVPFAWRAVDPRTWWGFETEGRLVYCLEVTERTVADIVSRYRIDPSLLDPSTVSAPTVPGHNTPTSRQKKTFVEYWDGEWVAYVVDNIVLDAWQHGYGRVPYFPFYGLTNASEDEGHQGESVVEHIIAQEVAVDSLLTMKHIWAKQTCFPMGTIEGPEGSPPIEADLGPDSEGERQTFPEIEYKSGVFKSIPPGWKMKWVEPPGTGEDLNKMTEFLTNNLKEIIPNVLRGIGLSDQSGYGVNQLITAARLVFDPISDNAAVALQELIKFTWWLIENKIKEEVYILGEDPGDNKPHSGKKWLGLGPKDIYNYYACAVSITPLLPTNKIGEGQFGLDQWKQGAIPWRMHLEDYLHKDNPEEVIMEKLAEDQLYMGQGPLHEWAIQNAIEELELDKVLKQKQKEQAMGGVMLPSGIQERLDMGMAPPGPGTTGPMGPGGPIPAGPGVPAPENLAPQPGLGMPLTPQPPPAPGMPGQGGRAAGVGIQPDMTQPGAIPGEM